jgi:hypothetical protein
MLSTTRIDTDLIEALDEFLEQGIKSGAFAELGGTGWNRTAEQEAAILRSHLSDFLVFSSHRQARHRRDS